MSGLPRHMVGAQAALRLAGLSRDLRPATCDLTADLFEEATMRQFHGA
jgi:hypothetical protein